MKFRTALIISTAIISWFMAVIGSLVEIAKLFEINIPLASIALAVWGIWVLASVLYIANKDY